MKQFALMVFIILTACTSCTHTVPCLNQYVTPAFIGFALTDLDTLVIREYKKDDNFNTLLDTTLLVMGSDVLSAGTSNDTTIILLNHISGEEKYLFPDHDWQIYIPAQNRVITISNFDSPQKEHTCTLGGDLCPGCANPINSFFQDGQEVIPQYGKIPLEGADNYLTYIHH